MVLLIHGLAQGTGVLVFKHNTVFGTEANSALEVGILGCGGRGNYIGEFFVQHAGAKVVALQDPFRDRLEAAQKTFKVDSARLYNGLDSYRDLVNSKLDAVIIESPPYYHPEQAGAAVAAGKHVYLAKPVAVDVPVLRASSQVLKKQKAGSVFSWTFKPAPSQSFRKRLDGSRKVP